MESERTSLPRVHQFHACSPLDSAGVYLVHDVASDLSRIVCKLYGAELRDETAIDLMLFGPRPGHTDYCMLRGSLCDDVREHPEMILVVLDANKADASLFLSLDAMKDTNGVLHDGAGRAVDFSGIDIVKL